MNTTTKTTKTTKLPAPEILVWDLLGQDEALELYDLCVAKVLRGGAEGTAAWTYAAGERALPVLRALVAEMPEVEVVGRLAAALRQEAMQPGSR